MSDSAKEYLRHIQQECDYLLKTFRNVEFEDFYDNETLKRAAVRSIEIIGEVSKKIP